MILLPPIPAKRICQHCRKCKVNRPRGLCWGCFYRPGVKDLYAVGSGNPATAKYARRSRPDFNGRVVRAPAPTTWPPGSPEKVAVMVERADLGQAIFHPADARYDGDPLPMEFLRRQPATVPSGGPDGSAGVPAPIVRAPALSALSL